MRKGTHQAGLQDQLRHLRQSLSAVANDKTIQRNKKMKPTFILASFIALLVTGHVNDTAAEQSFKRLTAPQIKARLTGMEISDETHWRDVYEANGSIRSYSMGKKRIGKWNITQNELCVDVGEREDAACYEVWLKGDQIELRRSNLDFKLEGVLRKPSDRVLRQ